MTIESMRCGELGLGRTTSLWTHACIASILFDFGKFLCFVCFDWICDFRIILLNKCLYFACSTHTHTKRRVRTREQSHFHSIQVVEKLFHHARAQSGYSKTTSIDIIVSGAHGTQGSGCRFVCCQSLMWKPTSRFNVCVWVCDFLYTPFTSVQACSISERILNWIILKLSSCVNLMMDEDKAEAQQQQHTLFRIAFGCHFAIDMMSTARNGCHLIWRCSVYI